VVQAGAGIVAIRIRRASSGRRRQGAGVLKALALAKAGGEYIWRLCLSCLSTTGEQSIACSLAASSSSGAPSPATSDLRPTISAGTRGIARRGGVKVKDVGSSNGPFLNGARITEAIAVENDVITSEVAFRVKE